jgi:hypothetical protein
MFGLCYDMRILHSFLLFFLFKICFSQNVVPNPSFEDVNYDHCGLFPTPEKFESATKNWFVPTMARPNIESKMVSPHCWNYIPDDYPIQPRTGKRMASLCFYSEKDKNFRSYLEVQLVEELKPNKRYFIQIWVHLSHRAKFASNNIGLFFSDTLIKVEHDKHPAILNLPFVRSLPFSPQINFKEIVSDTSNWVCLEASFVPKSAAKFLLIGNFFEDKETEIKNIRSGENLESAIFYHIDDIFIGTEKP